MPKIKAKWRFAIGTTSIVPGTRRHQHYLLGDVDDKRLFGKVMSHITNQLGVTAVFVQYTPNGFHFYTSLQFGFRELCYHLRRIPGIDPAWIGIGENRGYFFLADKEVVELSWPVVRMVIHIKAAAPAPKASGKEIVLLRNGNVVDRVAELRKGFCSRCGGKWCNEHDCCPLDCADKH